MKFKIAGFQVVIHKEKPINEKLRWSDERKKAQEIIDKTFKD